MFVCHTQTLKGDLMLLKVMPKGPQQAVLSDMLGLVPVVVVHMPKLSQT